MQQQKNSFKAVRGVRAPLKNPKAKIGSSPRSPMFGAERLMRQAVQKRGDAKVEELAADEKASTTSG